MSSKKNFTIYILFSAFKAYNFFYTNKDLAIITTISYVFCILMFRLFLILMTKPLNPLKLKN